jgi:hypothetical protein
MGYGGFGNFEQLTGNIAAMSRVTGDSDSLEKLKNVLASAVAIGFNNSRLAQEFVRTTTELSQGLGITNTNYTSGLLAGGTGALAGMGIGGEMGLSIMAKGLSNYAQVTNSGGIYGAAKMIGMFSGGGRIGEAGAIIQSMSAPELSAGLDELSTGDIKSPKVLAMLQNIQSGRSGITRKQAIEMLQQQMSGGRTGVTSPIRAIMDMITKSQSDSEFDKKTPEEKTRILLSRGGEAGAAMPGLGFEGGIAAMAEQLSEMPGYLRGRAMEKYKAQVLKGSEAAQADKALAMRRRYSDSILRQTGNMMAGVSTGEYADEYKKGARMHFDDGTEIDPSKFNDPAYFEKAQKTLSGKSQFDLRMETAASLPDTDGVQPVRIMNASELGAAVLGGILARESVKETNLNKQDESPAPGMLGPP